MATGSDFANLALQQRDRGAMYEWAAAGPDTFDCSGLMYWAAQQLGITIPRTTYDMVADNSGLVPIARGDLQTGDLIFSDWGEGANSHVAMYVGDGQLVEAPQQGQAVQVNAFSDSYANHATNYRRIPSLNGKGGTSQAGAFVTGLGAGLGGPAGSALSGWINAPKTVTDAMSNVGNAAGNIAGSIAKVGKVADLIGKMFLPSNILRGFAMFFGIVFILIGIWFLAREVRESS